MDNRWALVSASLIVALALILAANLAASSLVDSLERGLAPLNGGKDQGGRPARPRPYGERFLNGGGGTAPYRFLGFTLSPDFGPEESEFGLYFRHGVVAGGVYVGEGVLEPPTWSSHLVVLLRVLGGVRNDTVDTKLRVQFQYLDTGDTWQNTGSHVDLSITAEEVAKLRAPTTGWVSPTSPPRVRFNVKFHNPTLANLDDDDHAVVSVVGAYYRD